MKTILTWRKNLFESTCRIFSNEQMVGELIDKPFSNSAYGELYGNKYYFKTRGFLNQKTDIFDTESQKAIGNITYNTWMTKARIVTGNKIINWRFENAWSTRWNLTDEQGNQIQYSASSSKGTITSDMDDPLLKLTGLYLANYYWQTLLTLFIAYLIIWISSTN